MVQRAQRDLEAFAFAFGADQPGRRDLAVVEVQLPGRRALDAELVFRRPNEKPSSVSSSTNAEIPLAPAAGSVTAITV
jgi:hypothetical protein